jgi:glyoxylase-like metal-dependent hydrolase (beta-lactamase superfamily II)
VVVFASRREHTTSTVVIGADRDVLLVDPAWEPDELAAIAGYLDERGLRVVAGFSSHAHHDHLLWHPGFGTAPRWASAATAAAAKVNRKALRAELGPDWPRALTKLVGRVKAIPAAPGGFRPLAAEPVEVIIHNAHAVGHSALWLPQRGVLLAGDMLSDVEPPLPSYSDDVPSVGELSAYLDGLEQLAPYVARADVLVPGHGRPTDRPMQRLDADRRYLDELITGVRITSGRGVRESTPPTAASTPGSPRTR